MGFTVKRVQKRFLEGGFRGCLERPLRECDPLGVRPIRNRRLNPTLFVLDPTDLSSFDESQDKTVLGQESAWKRSWRDFLEVQGVQKQILPKPPF